MRSMRSVLDACLAAALMCIFCGCDPRSSVPGPKYEETTVSREVMYVSAFPRYWPTEQAKVYSPLIRYLNRRIPGSFFEFEASKDYAQFLQRFREARPVLLTVNPPQVVEAAKYGYEVVAMAGSSHDLISYIVVRKDSGIGCLKDLKGRTVIFGPPVSMGSCLMQQYAIHKAGLDISRDIRGAHTSSFKSILENVCIGKGDAGCVPVSVWRKFSKSNPEQAEALQILWCSEPFMNNAVLMRKDIPESTRVAIRTALLDLRGQPEAAEILAGLDIDDFHPIGADDYAPTAAWLAKFETEVRKIHDQ